MPNVIAAMLGRQLSDFKVIPCEIAANITAFAGFTVVHCKKIWCTNLLKRANIKIEHRTDFVGEFPNQTSLLHLVGSVMIETHDEWHITDRRSLSEGSIAQINASTVEARKEVATPKVITS